MQSVKILITLLMLIIQAQSTNEENASKFKGRPHLNIDDDYVMPTEKTFSNVDKDYVMSTETLFSNTGDDYVISTETTFSNIEKNTLSINEELRNHTRLTPSNEKLKNFTTTSQRDEDTGNKTTTSQSNEDIGNKTTTSQSDEDFGNKTTTSQSDEHIRNHTTTSLSSNTINPVITAVPVISMSLPAIHNYNSTFVNRAISVTFKFDATNVTFNNNHPTFKSLKNFLEPPINNTLKENMTNLVEASIYNMRKGSLVVNLSLVTTNISREEYVNEIFTSLTNFIKNTNLTYDNQALTVTNITIENKTYLSDVSRCDVYRDIFQCDCIDGGDLVAICSASKSSDDVTTNVGMLAGIISSICTILIAVASAIACTCKRVRSKVSCIDSLLCGLRSVRNKNKIIKRCSFNNGKNSIVNKAKIEDASDNGQKHIMKMFYMEDIGQDYTKKVFYMETSQRYCTIPPSLKITETNI